MFEDFDIEPFKKIKPPGNFTFDTMQEIKALKKTPLNKKVVEKYDDAVNEFVKTAKDSGIKEDVKGLSETLANESRPIIMKLKKYFDRPRPKELAKKMNIKMKDHEMKSMKTPSYPSGHSAQGFLIALTLGDRYPQARNAFLNTAIKISDSRNIARAHYKSDSDMGKKLGNAMYDHIKNRV